MSNMRLVNEVLIGGLLTMAFVISNLEAEQIFWVGDESDDWHTGTNWTASCNGGPICAFLSPGTDDDAIVTNSSFGFLSRLSDHAQIHRLTITNGMDVDANGFQLAVIGGPQSSILVSGGGSTLRAPALPSGGIALLTNQLQLSSGGYLFLGEYQGDRATVNVQLPGASVAASSGITGNGTVQFSNAGGGPTTSVLINDGTIQAMHDSLKLKLLSDGAFDLDGASGNGILDADDGSGVFATNLFFDVLGPLTDPFDGTLQIGENDRVTFTEPWQFGDNGQAGSGTLQMRGVGGSAILQGAPITVRGSSTVLNVLNGTGVFISDLKIHEATMNVSSGATVKFIGEADFGSDSTFNGSSGYQMIVRGTTVFRQPVVNWDGPNETGHQTTIEPGGILEFQTDAIEVGGSNQFDGAVSVNGGVLSVLTNGAWVMNGILNLNNVTDSIGRVSGQHFIVGNGVDTGPDAAVNVGGVGETRITAQTTFRSDVELSIGALAQLRISNNVTIETGAEVFGSGTLINDGNLSIQNGISIPGKLQNIDRLTLAGPTTFSEVTVGEYEQSGQFTRLTLDIGDATTNMFDRLTVIGNAALDGILDVDLASLTEPTVGDQFPLITANSITGTFDSLQLPPLMSGDVWSVQYNPTSVILEVVSPLTADFDMDGDVDGRDFLVWQRGGSPNGINSGDLALWQSQFGLPLVAATAAVPEPGAAIFFIATWLLFFSLGRTFCILEKVC